MIRPATTTDYDAFATLFRELGLEEAPPSRDRFCSDQVRGTYVLDNEERAIDGYVLFQKLGTIGYVRQLVVGPRARHAGKGEQLMRAVARELSASGIREWHLNVEAGNTAAIRLYERLGLIAEHRSTAVRLAWRAIEELPHRPAIALPIEDTDDAELENVLRLLPGQIAMARRRPTVILRQLRDESCAPLGLATFDPEFPGARIFRVVAPIDARALLHALRPHARHDHLSLVIDDDDALTELLVAHGAEVKLRLLHYSGPVPAG